ncbi:MAG TPA: hypothetical protein VIO59_11310 [Rhodanobacter sp.]
MAETSALLACCRRLADRAQVNNQQTLHFVLALTADSLADNLATASDMDDGDA